MLKPLLTFMLSSLLQVFCLFSIGADIKSPSDYLPFLSAERHDSMKFALELMEKRQPSVIVETGTARGGLYNFVGDGGSTIIFGTWAEVNNKAFYSVDINPTAIEVAKNALASKADSIHFVCDDSLNFLKDFDSQIDFLYLDSFDYQFGNPGPSQEHHLKEITIAYNKLSPNAIVMIDDCALPEGGKGKLVIAYLLNQGWKIIYDGYQVILARAETIQESNLQNLNPSKN